MNLDLVYETVEFDEKLYEKNIQEKDFNDEEKSNLSQEDIVEKEAE